MAQGKVTPFKDSKFYIQTGVSVTTEAITAATAANPGTITATSTTVVKGDVVVITGLGEDFDGTYAVASVATSVITLAGADWSGNTVPGSYTSAVVAKATFSSNWAELTAFSKAGGTIDQNEVSSLVSNRKEFEPGLADSGTAQFSFNYAPATAIQDQLKAYETSAEKFWQKLVLTRSQGTLLFYGSIQTGANIDGSVGGVYKSGVTIKLSGDYFRIAAA